MCIRDSNHRNGQRGPGRPVQRARDRPVAERFVHRAHLPLSTSAAGDSPMTTRARAGMTLMELVIGLAITGLMAAAGAGAFASIIDHKRVIRTCLLYTSPSPRD